MKVYFLGTGTSQGIPVIGSDHPVCLSLDQKDKRLRVSIWVEWDNNSFVIDKDLDEKRIGTLIADGSNSRGYLKKLAKFAEERKIPFHSVLDKGAFVLTN